MDNKSIGITIGITAFNEGSLLSDAWKSVLNQTCDKWEAVMVLDGGGSWKTKKYYSNIHHLRLKKYYYSENQGAYKCRTKAIELSNTNWYFHLDADDLLPQNAVELVIDYILRNPEAEYIAGAYKNFALGPDQIVYPQSDVEILTKCPLFIATSPITKTLFKKIGGYYIPNNFMHSDWDFWLSVYEENIKGYITDEVIYKRRRRNNSLTWKNLHNLQKGLEMIINRHPIYFNIEKRRSVAKYDLYVKLAGHYKSIGKRKLALINAEMALNYGHKPPVFDIVLAENRMNYARYLLRRIGRHISCHKN